MILDFRQISNFLFVTYLSRIVIVVFMLILKYVFNKYLDKKILTWFWEFEKYPESILYRVQISNGSVTLRPWLSHLLFMGMVKQSLFCTLHWTAALCSKSHTTTKKRFLQLTSDSLNIWTAEIDFLYKKNYVVCSIAIMICI